MNKVLIHFCWLIAEVQLMIERIDSLKGTPAYTFQIKAGGNLFLKALEAYNAKIHKLIGGADDVERGQHAIANIVDQQHQIREYIDITNVDELMAVQAYNLELIEHLKTLRHGTTDTEGASAEPAREDQKELSVA
jgi:hypothetical protein